MAVRTASGFHAGDPFQRHDTVFRQEFCVLFGIDIIGDNTDAVIFGHAPGKGFYESGLAGTYRAGYADFYIRHNRSFFLYLL